MGTWRVIRVGGGSLERASRSEKEYGANSKESSGNTVCGERDRR